jgi:hypothetical protein
MWAFAKVAVVRTSLTSRFTAKPRCVHAAENELRDLILGSEIAAGEGVQNLHYGRAVEPDLPADQQGLASGGQPHR